MSQKESATVKDAGAFRECPLLGQATKENCDRCMYKSLIKGRRKCLYGETSIEVFAKHRDVPEEQIKSAIANAHNNIQRCLLLYRYLEWVEQIAPIDGMAVTASAEQWVRVMEKLPVLNIAGLGIAPQVWIIGYKATLWKRYQQQHDLQVEYTLDQLYGLLPVALQALQWARSKFVSRPTKA